MECTIFMAFICSEPTIISLPKAINVIFFPAPQRSINLYVKWCADVRKHSTVNRYLANLRSPYEFHLASYHKLVGCVVLFHFAISMENARVRLIYFVSGILFLFCFDSYFCDSLFPGRHSAFVRV